MVGSSFTRSPAWARGFLCTVLVTAHLPALTTGFHIVRVRQLLPQGLSVFTRVPPGTLTIPASASLASLARPDPEPHASPTCLPCAVTPAPLPPCLPLAGGWGGGERPPKPSLWVLFWCPCPCSCLGKQLLGPSKMLWGKEEALGRAVGDPQNHPCGPWTGALALAFASYNYPSGLRNRPLVCLVPFPRAVTPLPPIPLQPAPPLPPPSHPPVPLVQIHCIRYRGCGWLGCG